MRRVLLLVMLLACSVAFGRPPSYIYPLQECLSFYLPAAAMGAGVEHPLSIAPLLPLRACGVLVQFTHFSALTSESLLRSEHGDG